MKKIKKPTKKQWNTTLYIVSVVALVALGVVGTLKYQAFIEDVKQAGVAEYIVNYCNEYTDPKSDQTWLECDIN